MAELPELVVTGQSPYAKYSHRTTDNYQSEVNKHIDHVTQLQQNAEQYTKQNDHYHNELDEYSEDSWSIDESFLHLYLPKYGVSDYINERALWQKGQYNLTGDPGFFYFKVFFNFNTANGLLGGIMNSGSTPLNSCNTAIKYLYAIRNYYTFEKINDRMLALLRFTYLLSYISSVAPWFFIGVNGLGKLNNVITKDFTREKSIDLVCNQEAVDMRLGELMDLYKYACYDHINGKEIIPENLRKFDMSIVVMNTPISFFQTAFKNRTNNTFYKDKKLYPDNGGFDDILSFQMYTLKGCEIDTSSFEGYIGTMDNKSFSKLGGHSIKIKYDKSFKHSYNEFNRMLYGDLGFGIDDKRNLIKRNGLIGIVNDRISKNLEDIYCQNFNTQESRIKALSSNYKKISDFSEETINDIFKNTSKYCLGNIKGSFNYNNDSWNKIKSEYMDVEHIADNNINKSKNMGWVKDGIYQNNRILNKSILANNKTIKSTYKNSRYGRWDF